MYWDALQNNLEWACSGHFQDLQQLESALRDKAGGGSNISDPQLLAWAQKEIIWKYIPNGLLECEQKIVYTNIVNAIKTENKKASKQYSESLYQNALRDSQPISDVRILNEIVDLSHRMSHVSQDRNDLKTYFRQRNIFAIACGLALAISVVLAVLAFVFANPLSFIISGAVFLSSGVAFGVTSLTRHVQYQNKVNDIARTTSFVLRVMSQNMDRIKRQH